MEAWGAVLYSGSIRAKMNSNSYVEIKPKSPVIYKNKELFAYTIDKKQLPNVNF